MKSPDRLLKAHLRHFPGEARGLRRLAEVSAEMYREFAAYPMRPRLWGLLCTPLSSRALFRYRNATMKDVIDSELTDPRLKAVYATLWPWLGAPPSRASFLMWAVMMGAYIEDGAY